MVGYSANKSLVNTFDGVEKFSDHKSNVFDPLLSCRDPGIKSHTVVELPAALVHDSVEEGEGRSAGVGRHLECQVVDNLTADYVEVRVVFFVH